MMKGVVYTKYGSPEVLQLQEVAKPEPKANQIAVNVYHPILDYKRALSPQGTCVVVGGSLTQVLQGMLLGPLVSRVGRKKIGFMGIATTSTKDLVVLKELLETEKVVPVIDKCYPLSEVAEAIRYLTEIHAQGKVVITVE